MATAVQTVQDVPQPKLDPYIQAPESKHDRESPGEGLQELY
jgi:hypothetical protein